jgi:hypothetical protein
MQCLDTLIRAVHDERLSREHLLALTDILGGHQTAAAPPPGSILVDLLTLGYLDPEDAP